MRPLVIDPAIPFVAPPGPVAAVVVGCGGTGGYVAQNLARLARHGQDTGLAPISIYLIDGDEIEMKNVGRQNFAPAEIGRNKAQALALRFGQALGLRIVAIPQMATAELLAEVARAAAESPLRLLLGAVDSLTGREAMRDAVAAGGWSAWIDAGNHDHAGQVAVGNTVAADQLAGAFGLQGMVTRLPAVNLTHPSIFRAPPPAEPLRNCAADLEDNLQSMMINPMMATIASEYAAKLIIERRLHTYETTVQLQTLAMRSTPITAANVAASCEIPLAKLTKQQKGKAA